ncbi:bifunctional phosphoserine phosphatase/homoserine phosphotransferase ThrH [Sphaerochaeta sp. PS]|uniref:bifunctional phosphoserine phosphatase/homoserine phosphotransferase ThrH n=1 Tax=Sphaerochaeta sp. PS TaxID=3076336 RepID=UPI0028A558B0|nr:bifunctional phosphoserine phosphatase/homoserine phosphotransferase ThrH [Sphaerochaeta sp. PS]MDT4761959.1 bifunctional phosphoserine phosphatase/homoserine phosphotransferase ThrH [Sphaerochaeta sp. PS]
MDIVCLDLEGVLVPEIWINVAKKTGIAELRLTTRDISDYDKLMKGRIEILKAHGLTLSDIQDVIATIEPLEGALDFLNGLRSMAQVLILSDTFTEFAQPLMKQLLWPTLWCNDLVISSEGMIEDYRMRLHDGKYHAVKALKSLNFRTFAAGDSYNDLAMIEEADAGCLFRPPQGIVASHPHLKSTTTYEEFSLVIEEFLHR